MMARRIGGTRGFRLRPGASTLAMFETPDSGCEPRFPIFDFHFESGYCAVMKYADSAFARLGHRSG